MNACCSTFGINENRFSSRRRPGDVGDVDSAACATEVIACPYMYETAVCGSTWLRVNVVSEDVSTSPVTTIVETSVTPSVAKQTGECNLHSIMQMYDTSCGTV